MSFVNGASRGIAREIGLIGFNVAVWPLGLVDSALRHSMARVRQPKLKRHRRRMTNDAAEVPVILIHGYFHNHSGLMVMKRSLRKHGFKHVRAFTYNPLRRGIPEMAECVRDRVQEIKRTTGARKVHLVGHSLGGILARYYVEQMDGAKSVKTLVTLGTPHSGTLVAYAGRSPAARQLRPGSEVLRRLEVARKPKKVRYVSYYSNLDALIVPASSAILRSEDATNIKLKDLGHLSMLISPQVISSIAWQLSNGGRV